MRLQRFNDGDLVTLKFEGPYRVIDGPRQITDFPKYGNVYTVSGYTDYIRGRGWFITLREISSRIEFAEVDFAYVAVRVLAMQEREFILNLN